MRRPIVGTPSSAEVRNAAARRLVTNLRRARRLRAFAEKAVVDTIRENQGQRGRETEKDFRMWVDQAERLRSAAEQSLVEFILCWCGRAYTVDELRPGWEPCAAEIDGTVFVVAALDEDGKYTAPRLIEVSAAAFVSSQDDC